jgi:3-dehydroquinate synthase
MEPDHSPSSLTIDLGPRSYRMHVRSLEGAPGLMREAGLDAERCFVVTDENVASLYLDRLMEALRAARFTPEAHVVAPGEQSKSEAPLRRLYDAALEWGLDRQTPVAALGGGVVGDLAGFAAATLLRGLPLVHLPTSLVAQVDSSLGGKTGINHATGKNLIGAFHQPALVAADPEVLETLPQREWTSGLAEVVKHALIADANLLAFLREHWAAILNREAGLLPEMIHRAARVKAEVVAEDEREQGRRAILNFGHTFGHAIEHAAGYGSFTHGEAVAVGMRAALFLSRERHPDFDGDAALDLVTRLPVRGGDPARLSFEALRRAMQQDKKNEGDAVRFVLLRAAGEAHVAGGFDDDTLEAAWQFALRSGD